MSSSTPSNPTAPSSTHTHVTRPALAHPRPQLQPQLQPHRQPHQQVAPSPRRPRRDAIVARGESISLARRAAATAKKRREKARAELERRGIREGVDSALAGIVAQSARTRANVSQNKSKRSKRVKWTKEEVHALQEGVSQYGEGRWAVILRELAPRFHSCRISVDLKDKWRNLYKAHRGGVQEAENHSLRDHKRVHPGAPNPAHINAAPASQDTLYVKRAELMKQNAVFTVPALDKEVTKPRYTAVTGRRQGRVVPSGGSGDANLERDGDQRQDLKECKKETFHAHPSESVEFVESTHHGDEVADEVHTEHPVHYEDLAVATHALSADAEAEHCEQEEGTVVEEHFQQDQPSRPHEQETNANQHLHSNSANFGGQLGGQQDVRESDEVIHVEERCEAREHSEVNDELATEIGDPSSEQQIDERQPLAHQENTLCEQEVVLEEVVVHEEHVNEDHRIVHDEDTIHDGDEVHEDCVVQESQIGHEAEVGHADVVTEDGQVAQDNSVQDEGNSELTHAGTVATVSPLARVDMNESEIEESREPELPSEPRPGLSDDNTRELQQSHQCRMEVPEDGNQRFLKPSQQSECAQQVEVPVCQQSISQKTSRKWATNVDQCSASQQHYEDGGIQNSPIEPGERSEHYHEQGMHQDDDDADRDEPIAECEHEIQEDHIEHGDVVEHPGFSVESERVAEVEDGEQVVDERYADVEIHEEHCEHANREPEHGDSHEYYEEEEENHDGHHQHYEEHHESHEDLGDVHYEDDENEEQSLRNIVDEEREYETIEQGRGHQNAPREELKHEPHLADHVRIPTDNTNYKTMAETGSPAEAGSMDDLRKSSGLPETVADSECKDEAGKPNFDAYEAYPRRVQTSDAARRAIVSLQNRVLGRENSNNDGRVSEDRGEQFPQETRGLLRAVGEGGCGMGSANATTEDKVRENAEMKGADRTEIIDHETGQDLKHDRITMSDKTERGVGGRSSTGRGEGELRLRRRLKQRQIRVDQDRRMKNDSSESLRGEVNKGDDIRMRLKTETVERRHEGVNSDEIEDNCVGAGEVMAVEDFGAGLECGSEARTVGRMCEDGSGQVTEAERSRERVEVEKGAQGMRVGMHVESRGIKRELDVEVQNNREIARAERRQRRDSEAKTPT